MGRGNEAYGFSQKTISPPGNNKNAGNDFLITEKSKVTGPAQPPTKPIEPEVNLPNGQEVI